MAQTSSGTVNVVRFAVRPSRPRSCAAASASSIARAGSGGPTSARSSRGRVHARRRGLASPRAARQVDVFLASRVSSAALLAAKPAVPRASMCSTTGCRRVENARSPPRHARELSHPFAGCPFDPERAGELVAEVRLVEVAGGEPVGLEDRLAVERSPLAVARRGPCWRRSHACAGAGPARGWCGAGKRRRRSRPRARGSRRCASRTTHASSSR